MDKRLQDMMDELICTTGIAIMQYKKNKDIEYLDMILNTLNTLKNAKTDNIEFKDRIDELITDVEFMKTDPTEEQLEKYKVHVMDNNFRKARECAEEHTKKSFKEYHEMMHPQYPGSKSS